MFRKCYEVVGIAGDADIHCLPCAYRAYSDSSIRDMLNNGMDYPDRENNPLGVVFLDSLTDEDHHCTVCGADLYETEFF
jgi:hypothetical protein